MNTEKKTKKKDEIKPKKIYREFTVTPGMYGFKVKIGCSELYFSTAEQVGNAIQEYMKDPARSTEFFVGIDHRLKESVAVAPNITTGG